MMHVSSVKVLVFFCVLFVVVWGCGDKLDPLGSGGIDDLPDVVTYDDHIELLLEERCLSCHSEDVEGSDRNFAPADVNFDDYEDAVYWSSQSNQRIQAGTMPPGSPLSSYERALFQRWIDQGWPE